MKLTKTIVDAIQATDRETWVWCSTLPGFGVRAQASGRKTFVARYRTHDGTQRKLTLGRCCDLTPDQARELARKAFARAAAGEDPANERKELRQAPTVAELAEKYMTLHAIPFKKPASAAQDRRNWDQHILPLMGGKRVDAVTTADVAALMSKLAYSHVTANHARAVLSKAMNLAIAWGMRKNANPCFGVRKFRVRQRERVLTPDELGRLYRALPAFGAFRDLVLLLLLTGCRLGEIMTAKREWVDEQRRLLLLPDSKVGQRRIPLPAAALEIIQAMPPGQKWLIPSMRTGGRTHLEKPYHSWYEMIARAQLPGLRFHDLRHSFGSIGHMAGLTQRQIADMLGHSSMKTTERYLHGYAGDAAHAVDAVAERISSAWKAHTPQ